MLNTSIVKISRSTYIEENIDVAILRLDTFRHTVGQPVTVRYYEAEGGIDALFAIGVKDGIGKDCYSLVSADSEFMIHSVLYEVPDVTELVNGEIYLCKNEGIWNFLSLGKNGEKVLDPNIPDPKVIREIISGYRWFYVDGTLKREDDFVSGTDINNLIYKNLNQLYHPEIKITGRTEMAGTTIENPEFDITVLDYAKQDISSRVSLHITEIPSEEVKIHEVFSGKLKIYGEFTESTEFKVEAKYVLDDTEIEFEPSENLKLIFASPVFMLRSESEEIEDPSAESEYFSLSDEGKFTISDLAEEYVSFYLPEGTEVSGFIDSDFNDISSKFNTETITIEGIGNYTKFNSIVPISGSLNIITDSYTPDLNDAFDKNLIIFNLKQQAILEAIPVVLTQEAYDEKEANGEIEPGRTYMILKPEEE